MDTVSPHALGLPGNNLVLVSGTGNAVADPNRTPTIKRLYRMGLRWKWVLVGGVVAGMLLGMPHAAPGVRPPASVRSPA